MELQGKYKTEFPLQMEKSKVRTRQGNEKQLSYVKLGTGISLCRKLWKKPGLQLD